jgi:hypothetical protein
MRKLLIPALVFSMILLFTIWHKAPPDAIYKTNKWEIELEEEIEKEGGLKRDAWEWKLLRDPKTGKIPSGIRNREMSWVKKMPIREYGLLNSPELNNKYNAVGPSPGWQNKGFCI